MSATESDKAQFAVWLLNKLAKAWGLLPAEAYRLLQSQNIMDDYVLEFYDPLHSMGELALVEDITVLARSRGIGV